MTKLKVTKDFYDKVEDKRISAGAEIEREDARAEAIVKAGVAEVLVEKNQEDDKQTEDEQSEDDNAEQTEGDAEQAKPSKKRVKKTNKK